jgi:hypothetical protein
MKKIILSLMVVLAMASSFGANAQNHRRITYRYYPDANVYYNTQTHQYAYDNNGNWGYQRDLPSNVTVNRRSYVTVYGNDQDIWRDNPRHKEKYKNWGHKNDRGRNDRDKDDQRDKDDHH